MKANFGRPFRLRVPPREPREPKTYDPPPEAVANLKRILAEREGEKQRQAKASIQNRTARRRQAPANQVPEPTSEPVLAAKEDKSVAKTNYTNFKELMTAERAAAWARMRREGQSYDYITKHDELHPSAPTIKTYLKKYGYTTKGERMGQKADPPALRKAKSVATPAVVKQAPSPLVTTNGREPALPAEQVTSQLQAIQQLLHSVQAGEVRVSGKIRMELNVEIEVGS